MEDMQRAEIEWARKGQERLTFINNKITKEHKAEKRFTDLNAAMRQYFLVTGRRLEPLPPNQFSLIFTYHLKTTIIVSLHL